MAHVVPVSSRTRLALTGCLVGVVFACWADAAKAQTFIVESRSGGANYANYAESGTWANSTGKSAASGCTGGIGSRYAMIGAGAGTASFSFTPTTTGLYQVYTTNASTTNAGNPLIHTVGYAGGVATLAVCQNSTCNPNPCNTWYSLGTYALQAGAAYNVTVNAATGSGSGPASNVARADAVKWEYYGPANMEYRGFWADIWGVGYKTSTDIDNMVNRAVQGGYNLILAEVLGYQDNASSGHGSYWNSSIVPKAPDIQSGLDPLAYLCQKAHAQGIQVHAWIAPFRVSGSWPPAGNTTLASHPEYLMVPRASMGAGATIISDAYYLDAGSPDVQEYILSIVRELVTNYEIDGVQLDYIRYVQQDAGYPASNSYTKSTLQRFWRMTGRSDTPPATGDAAWNDFRRRTVTELVRRCRAEIPGMPSARQPVRLEASVITQGNAPASFTSSAAYGLFSNWEEWQRLGYLDACIPMTYYEEATYPTYYRNWVDKEMLWTYDRHMVVGPGIYLNAVADSITQMDYARSAGADGLVTYSYRATRNDGGNAWDWYPYVASNFFTTAASVPSMPWRSPATATEGTLWGRVTEAGSGVPLDDASVQVGSLAPVKTDANGYYVVTLISASGSGTSYTVTATANDHLNGSSNSTVVAGTVGRQDFSLTVGGYPPTITANPASIIAATGSTAVFAVQVTGSAPFTYQWQKNAVNLSDGGHYSGCTTPSLVITSVDGNDMANYRCVVTNNYGNTTSGTATLGSGALAEEYIVESRSGGLNYAQYSETGTWSSSTGKSTAAGCTPGIGSRYCSIGANPATAVFTFTPAVTDSYEIFTTNPSTTNSGNPLVHTVAHASGPTNRPVCQNTTCSPSASNAWVSLGTYALTAGTPYTVAANVSTAVGSAPVSGMGRADAIKWTRITAVILPPTITQQPTAQNVCPGAAANFTVTASGDGLTYRWQKNQVNLSDGGHYSGTTTATLTISNADAGDAANYRCVVTNSGGSATSNEAALTLKAATSITQQPVAQSVCSGGSVNFTVAATGEGTLAYQWQKNGANLTDGGHYAGVTTATLTVSSVNSADVANYACVVTAGCGSLTSSQAALSLKAATTITQQPTAKNVAAGGNTTFTVTATGDGSLTYQWQKNSANLANGGHYSGVTTATLTVSSCDYTDVANYRCVVTAGCGSATSNQAALTVTLISDSFSYTNQSAFVAVWPILTSPGGTLSTSQYYSSPKSIYISTAAARNSRNFTATVASDAAPIVFKYRLYDTTTGTLDRQFCEIDDAAPSLAQLIAIGKYNGAGMNTYYAGRVAFAPGPNWFALDGAGAPVRSVGWHELKAVVKSTTVDFYVDGVLAKANVAYANTAGQFSFDQARLGSGLTSANAAYYDDFSVVSGQ